MSEQHQDPSMNVRATIITVSAMVVGAVLVALGHESFGATLIAFSVGVGAFKPIKDGI